jgi:phosphodiesterase/alkaline phosphatase D-like protein
VVTISDGTNTREFDFTMESEPPPTPAPVPVTDVTAESTLQLQWEDVDDASLPVSYSLQIASDENFASITLEKKGLTESEYTLTEGERLKPTRKETPYYWRVKATDSAANESEWSTTGSFNVTSGSALPTWGIILLIVFGVLVIGFLVFRLSRRRTYDEDY